MYGTVTYERPGLYQFVWIPGGACDLVGFTQYEVFVYAIGEIYVIDLVV